MTAATHDLTCRELSEFLGEYTDGTLAAEERVRFETHLRACPECAAYVRSYADTIQLAKGTRVDPDDPVPAEVPDELVRAILAARRR